MRFAYLGSNTTSLIISSNEGVERTGPTTWPIDSAFGKR